MIYYLQYPNMEFRCSARFYKNGVCAFETIEPFEILRKESGYYHSEVIIPENLLAEGEYIIGVSVFKAREKKLYYCQLDDLIFVQVFDPMTGNSAKGDCPRGIEGIVRPLLQWECKKITEINFLK